MKIHSIFFSGGWIWEAKKFIQKNGFFQKFEIFFQISYHLIELRAVFFSLKLVEIFLIFIRLKLCSD